MQAAWRVAPVVTTSSTTSTRPATPARGDEGGRAGQALGPAPSGLRAGAVGAAQQAAGGHAELAGDGPGQHLGLVVAAGPAPRRCRGRPRHHVDLAGADEPGHGRPERAGGRAPVAVLERVHEAPAVAAVGEDGGVGPGAGRREAGRRNAGHGAGPGRVHSGQRVGRSMPTVLRRGCHGVARSRASAAASMIWSWRAGHVVEHLRVGEDPELVVHDGVEHVVGHLGRLDEPRIDLVADVAQR